MESVEVVNGNMYTRYVDKISKSKSDLTSILEISKFKYNNIKHAVSSLYCHFLENFDPSRPWDSTIKITVWTIWSVLIKFLKHIK